MVDITQKPYFLYDDAIAHLSQAIQSVADVRVMGFRRKFLNGQHLPIYNSQYKDFWTEYWGEGLYRYGVLEKDISRLPSAFHMWDLLPFAPPEIYDYLQKEFKQAHGLTIIQQYGTHADSFLFATSPGNNLINHFYLNQKELFTYYIRDFYHFLENELGTLMQHTLILPENTHYVEDPRPSLTHRQRECAHYLVNGFSAKETARQLSLSPRTVESHLNVLKDKFRVKEREQLIKALSRFM